MHDSISFGIENRVGLIEEVNQVDVQLVWEPQWTPDKMSDEAKKILWG